MGTVLLTPLHANGRITCTYLNERNISFEDLKHPGNRQVAQELVNLLLEKTNLSKRNIAFVLELNREFVRKAAVSKEPSP